MRKKMKRLIAELQHIPNEPYNTYSYAWVQRIHREFEWYFRYMNTKELTLELIDYLSRILREELLAISHTYFLTHDDVFNFISLVPMTYNDEKGIEHKIWENNDPQTIELNLSDNVLIAPWNRVRLAKAFENIKKNGFIYGGTNAHDGDYYKGLNLAVVTRGTHSCTAGAAMSGKMPFNVIDVTKLFDHVSTNGAYWINIHKGTTCGEVSNPYIAVLYSLAKMRYLCETYNTNDISGYATLWDNCIRQHLPPAITEPPKGRVIDDFISEAYVNFTTPTKVKRIISALREMNYSDTRICRFLVRKLKISEDQARLYVYRQECYNSI